jgi:hypothetical protein
MNKINYIINNFINVEYQKNIILLINNLPYNKYFVTKLDSVIKYLIKEEDNHFVYRAIYNGREAIVTVEHNDCKIVKTIHMPFHLLNQVHTDASDFYISITVVQGKHIGVCYEVEPELEYSVPVDYNQIYSHSNTYIEINDSTSGSNVDEINFEHNHPQEILKSLDVSSEVFEECQKVNSQLRGDCFRKLIDFLVVIYSTLTRSSVDIINFNLIDEIIDQESCEWFSDLDSKVVFWNLNLKFNLNSKFNLKDILLLVSIIIVSCFCFKLLYLSIFTSKQKYALTWPIYYIGVNINTYSLWYMIDSFD